MTHFRAATGTYIRFSLGCGCHSTVRMAESPSERTVVIGMDGSHFSSFAFDWYMANVHKKSDHVILAYCPEYHSMTCAPMGMTDPSVLQEIFYAEEKRIKDFAEGLGDRLKKAGIGGRVKTQSGVPGHVIVKIAKEENAALIVTGCRGLGTIRRTFLGSVSDYVVHHSDVPVIVCRHCEHVCHQEHKHGHHEHKHEHHEHKHEHHDNKHGDHEAKNK